MTGTISDASTMGSVIAALAPRPGANQYFFIESIVSSRDFCILISNNPIFVVGCPRSGTTLVQSLLASSDELYSQPETNVLYRIAQDFKYRCYGRAIGRRNIPGMLRLGAVNKLGVTRNFSWRDYIPHVPEPFAEEIERRGLGRERRIGRIYRQFDAIMNTLAGGGRWVEKTPQNLFVLDYIEKFFKRSKFIHIVRPPLPNIASIMDAARQHEHFQYAFSGDKVLQRTVSYYNNAIEISRVRSARDNHMIIEYDRLTEDVPQHLRRMETFLSLRPDSLQAVYDTSRIAKKNEVWKKKPREVVKAKSKADAIFSAEEIAYIQEHTTDPARVFRAQ